jgi:hypothetical protein
MISIRNVVRFEVGETYRGSVETKHLTFKLIKRKDQLCIFERSDGYYEIIRLKYSKANDVVMGGVLIHFRGKEAYPKGKHWKGIVTDNLKRAMEIFKATPNPRCHPKLRY